MNTKIYFEKVCLYNLLEHEDNRGFFIELLNTKNFKRIYKDEFKCLQTSLAFSKKNVFRGFHIQKNKPIKQIITVIKGKVHYYFFDVRKKSKTFGQYKKILLSSKNKKILYLPEGFAGGYHCLDKENFILYHHNEFFYKKFDVGFNVFSENLNLKISKKVIRSNKDQKLKSFSDFILQDLK